MNRNFLRVICLALLTPLFTGGTMVDPDSKVEKITGGMKFLEGPVWIGNRLIFSDNVAGKLYEYEPGKSVKLFRDKSGTNGNTIDRQGRLVSCNQDKRTVERTEADGTITTLADKFDGKRFNSPNDVVVKSDDSIWFTDPPYGVPKGEKREIDYQGVFRIDAKTKAVTLLLKDMEMPNGLAFSVDEKILYVSDTGKPHHIKAYDVAADGTVGNGRVFCVTDKGVPDGFRVDAAGNIWTSAGDGVDIFDSRGKLIEKIAVPESPANVCFGGADGKTLFITARTGLYAVKLAAN